MTPLPKRFAFVTTCVIVAVVLMLHHGADGVVQEVEKSPEGSTLPPDVERSYLRATIVARVRPKGWKEWSGAPYGINKASHQREVTHNRIDSTRMRRLKIIQNKSRRTEDGLSVRNDTYKSAVDTNQTVMMKNEHDLVPSINKESVPSSYVTFTVFMATKDKNLTSNQQPSNSLPDSTSEYAKERELVERVPETFDVEEIQWNSSVIFRESNNMSGSAVPFIETTSQITGVQLNDYNNTSLTDPNSEKNKSKDNGEEVADERFSSDEHTERSVKLSYAWAQNGTIGEKENVENAHPSQRTRVSVRKDRNNTSLMLDEVKNGTHETRRSNDEMVSQEMKMAAEESSPGRKLRNKQKLSKKKQLKALKPKQKNGDLRVTHFVNDKIMDKRKETGEWKSINNNNTSIDIDITQADILSAIFGRPKKDYSDEKQSNSTDEKDGFENIETSGDGEVPFFSLSTTPDHSPPPPFKQTTPTTNHSKTTHLVSASALTVQISTDDTDRRVTTTTDQNVSLPNGLSPFPENDFQTTVLKLTSFYEQCDKCMLVKHDFSARSTCGYYDEQAKEFEVWSRKYVDLLLNGCPCAGQNHRAQCCHSPFKNVRNALVEMTRVTKDLQKILLNQCTKCPVDCQWESWGPWSDCPLICDNARVYRTRRRDQLSERYGGSQCQGKPTEDRLCPTTPSVVGKWLPWSSWTECQGRCEGIRFRYRDCEVPNNSVCYKHCDGPDKQSEPCTTGQCCYPRSWTDWSTWTACSEFDFQDESSVKVRYRTCDADPNFIEHPMCPTPCPGQSMEKQSCCHSYWSGWSEWTPCTSSIGNKDLDTLKDCDGGCRNRTRICRVTPPGCSEPQCDGNNVDHLDCELTPCCAPPVWSDWGSWGSCSVSSGNGLQRRSRHCHPDPSQWRRPTCNKHGCNGEKEQIEEQPCQGECENCTPPSWGSWHEWSTCDFQENPARRSRRRACRRAQSYNTRCQHLRCDGPDVDHELCICDPAQWSTWTAWSSCERHGGVVIRKRTHSCIQPNNPHYCPQFDCPGPSEETEFCCETPQWGTWGPWSNCDFSDYDSFMSQTRTRKCQVPPENLQNHCQRSCEGGKEEEKRVCQQPTRTTPEPFTTTTCVNCACVESCKDRADGDYPSCKQGCQHYITCCKGKAIENKCVQTQVYDSECRQCTYRTSQTCDENKYDKHIFEVSIRKPTDSECRRRTGTSG